MARFAAIGRDHRHIYDLVQGLRDAGQVCAGYWPETTDPRVLAGFRKRFPDVPAADKWALLDDGAIDFVVIAAVPPHPAPPPVQAMRRGGDGVGGEPAGAPLPATR